MDVEVEICLLTDLSDLIEKVFDFKFSGVNLTPGSVNDLILKAKSSGNCKCI